MLTAVKTEETIGEAEVRNTFKASRVGTIAGCMVTSGLLRRGAQVRVIRDSTVIYTTTIDSLKRFQDDAREVQEGFECGLHLANFDDVKVDDVLEAFETREIERTSLDEPPSSAARGTRRRPAACSPPASACARAAGCRAGRSRRASRDALRASPRRSRARRASRRRRRRAAHRARAGARRCRGVPCGRPRRVPSPSRRRPSPRRQFASVGSSASAARTKSMSPCAFDDHRVTSRSLIVGGRLRSSASDRRRARAAPRDIGRAGERARAERGDARERCRREHVRVGAGIEQHAGRLDVVREGRDVERREAVRRPRIGSGEAVALADDDPVERLERRLRGAHGVEDVAAAIGGAHQRGEACSSCAPAAAGSAASRSRSACASPASMSSKIVDIVDDY